MFRRLFIANRGEVAVRIARACDVLGVTPVLAVSEADRDASYVRGRESICIGPARAAESYLDPVRVIRAAEETRSTALHPGWGFLSENAMFAALVESHGITFVGPPAHVMQLMGQKTPAKRAVQHVGLYVIEGSDGPLKDADHAFDVAEAVGTPVLLKAESGGGGRGMRIARRPGEVRDAFQDAQNEARAAFGDPRVYLERLIEGGRHIEIQILADRYGHVVHLGERDCTVQRKHQKLVEESPAPALDVTERDRTFDAAVRAARAIGYVGAGTMEFLLDRDGHLRFMEMNTRLQVEHTVSEMRSGRDIVVEQIRIAAGHPLSFDQSEVALRGHAIECRINAEDPAADFRPAPGVIRAWHAPSESAGHVRVDTHVTSGYEVPPHYDSLLCKIITHGDTRDEACDRMLHALAELRCEGLPTTVPMHQAILSSPAFRNRNYHTGAIPGWGS